MPLTRFARSAYNAVLRERLPRKFGVYAGVPARGCRLLDATDHFPEYKSGLIEAIHENVSEGDDVELVGFGRGISTVHLLQAGAHRVTAHEASREMIHIGRETLAVNDVPADAVDVRHTLVGDGVEIYGSADGAEPVSPGDLTNADVLVLDCEGAEAGILEELGTSPEVVIVETHPERGVPTEATTDPLEQGYDLEIREYHPDRERKRVVVGETVEPEAVRTPSVAVADGIRQSPQTD